MGITSIPWIIKPCWGAISDGIPLFGYRRKSYLILFGFIQSICWISLSKWVKGPAAGVFVLITVQISIAFCNVIGG